MNILLFGGSFNPPHQGHRDMVKIALNNLHNNNISVDDVWVIPTYISKMKNLVDFSDRCKMCKLTFPKYKIKNYEERLEKKYDKSFLDKIAYPLQNKKGTYELTCLLKILYPTYNFFFLMGQDSYVDLMIGKWSGVTRRNFILDMLQGIVVVERDSKKYIYPFGKKNVPHLTNNFLVQRSGNAYQIRNIKFDICVIKCKNYDDIYNLSSTIVRNQIYIGDWCIKIPIEVMDYILKFSLY
jgi:nicotinate (nicotinamide) nucleotide adenylyltransferase